MSESSQDAPYLGAVIKLRGARQHNLKNLDLDIRTGEMLVVTGVSGSGKSSLVFDTLYAEGQRRYVETFSAYARQFLDRMDKPQIDRIEGVPPAIAIDQTNPVRTSRSTVGTMTELNDHFKLLFARTSTLFCRQCGQPVKRESPRSIAQAIKGAATRLGDLRAVVTFNLTVPESFGDAEVDDYLSAQGYTRVHRRVAVKGADGKPATELAVMQDRFRVGNVEDARLLEAIEAGLKRGHGSLQVHFLDEAGEDASVLAFSSGLRCAACKIDYTDPTPSLFSFNSPIGACEACKGFGRVIGVDLDLVIPDALKTLRQGAIKPWQTPSFKDCQNDLMRHAAALQIPLDVPWRDMGAEHKRWVLEGGSDWKGNWTKQWYGVRRFFDWLESKAYKMHIRVLLSKYRSYTECSACGGARLKPEALLWKVPGTSDQWLTVHQLMLLPIDTLRELATTWRIQVQEQLSEQGAARTSARSEAMDMLLTEIEARLNYLNQVGLGYLTLDRQARTLSGGEVQRINLTTALGTSLVNTLFVLDEPSIGLHPRDMARIVGVMHRLRDSGNTLVVVEHDPQVMLAADRLLDIGPGPGERGGQIVYYDRPQHLSNAATLTADYLLGRKLVAHPEPRPVQGNTPKLVLEGAQQHNLSIDSLEIPLQRMVCLTGVSGSGKSTLMQGILLPALLRSKGQPTEAPGQYRQLLGTDWLADVAYVDQSPIGKTARSNPVSYVGAFDGIRKLLAASDTARERGYTAGTFSFNSGDGRCPTCSGNGFEHVEMQFLSDVYLRCPDCDGKRFRAETLEVKLRLGDADFSVSDILELTVEQALLRFSTSIKGAGEIRARLQPLADVGLDYLKLGQPVPTLSGGEAQRLKLAGFLADSLAASPSKGNAVARKGTLFLFDEPTTGLHFDDVAKLIRALRKLLAGGHSLLIIEHNLDLMRASDWLIDLGPEGGAAGGKVVAQGTPAALSAEASTHTGQALRDYEAALASLARDGTVLGQTADASMLIQEPQGKPLQSVLRERAKRAIVVHHARENNLKGIDVEIPREAMTVITGVSGSGKSTLAFDVIFGEGQRRYLESLNAYARQFVQPASRPDVDGVYGIAPTVAIEQRTSRGGRKSTVATLTEIYHFLRLLFVKTGTAYCPTCDIAIAPQSFDSIVARIMASYRGQSIGLLAPLVINRKGVYTDLAKWASGKGFTHLRIDGQFVTTSPFARIDRFIEHSIELPVADVVVSPENEADLRRHLAQALELGKGMVMVLGQLDLLREAIDGGNATGAGVPCPTELFSTKRACGRCGTSYPELDPRLLSFNSKLGWCVRCYGTGVELSAAPQVDERRGDHDQTSSAIGDAAEKVADADASGGSCAACDGARLNPVALGVRVQGQSIAQVTDRSVRDAQRWVQSLSLNSRDAQVAQDLLTEIESRLKFLDAVGLGYLGLARSAPTLSGGEAQRIRLAAQLGSNLQGVCYVLDEPTIGLHPRDNEVLLDALDVLRAKGNTLLVVEHDEETIRRADHVIDIGPGAGKLGGSIVAAGHHEELAKQPASLTGRYLAHPVRHSLLRKRTPGHAGWLTLRQASMHNLKRVDVQLPLGAMTVITGVSGSGKSTLAREVLLANASAQVTARINRRAQPPLEGLEALDGIDAIDRVLEVDQTPIGKTPRSCPATYIGFWDTIRRLFADANESRVRGYSPARFSFNTGNGRCSGCDGQGQQTIEMNFLPDVKVLCEVCNGARFNRETLQVQLRDKSIGDVLAMTVDEALPYFDAHPSVRNPLQLLQDVGLGYLTLGQPSPTLSGGEAQRIKLVAELAKVQGKMASTGQRTLYVLDEPTVGLHMADVEKLSAVFQRLADAGHTLVLVEHNMDLWAQADWIIDLGPEGGTGGGQVVAMGTAATLVQANRSHTEQMLSAFLKDRMLPGAQPEDEAAMA
jgi:excinuclease ABC subunit A